MAPVAQPDPFAGVREQYDEVAGSYDLADRTPVKMHVMGPSVLALLRAELGRADLVGTVGLDLACGTGFLTRVAAGAGARMVGVDISPEMVAVARRRSPAGIEYRVGDVYALDVAGLRAVSDGYDFVVAGFLFNYATEPGQIGTLARAALAVLKPGGVVVGLLPNPDLPVIPVDGSTVRYGLSASMERPGRDGEPRQVTYWGPDGRAIVTVEHVHWSRDAYTREMTNAGAAVGWRHCEPAVAGAFWADYRAAPQHDLVVLRPVAD